MKKVREVVLIPNTEPVGIYSDGISYDAWFVGVEIARLLEYPEPVSSAVKAFKKAKTQILDELITMASYATVTGLKETTFLREEAVYLFLQYSNKPRAELIQLAIAKVLKEMRQTGLAMRPDLKELVGDFIQSPEDLRDPLKRGYIVLKQLEAFYIEQINLKEQVRETTEKLEDVARHINHLPITPTNLEKLHALVNSVVEMTGMEHKHVWNQVNDHFRVPKPESRRSRISLLLDSQFEDVKAYLLNWIHSKQKSLEDFYKEAS